MPRGRPDRALSRRPRYSGQRPGEGLGADRVEGRRAVRELLAAGRRRVDSVTLSRAQQPAPIIDEIVELAGRHGVPVRRLDGESFRLAASTSAPQGVVAEAAPLTPVRLEEIATTNDKVPFLVVLSEVTDPHNVGAILRSALGAGVTGVVIGRHRGARLSPAAVKAAAGAVEHLPIALVGGIPQALADLARNGVWTIGLDPQGEETLDSLLVADQPLAVVVGSEGHGLAPLVKKRCDVLCRIPLYGPVGSLNASVAAALALFSIAAKRLAQRAEPPDGKRHR